ncbi:LPD38 domain-containing protein [uncultured Megasphaera sp.]|uniref:LPD38 domain-containing protein n=1 Tax=uncultured Megasphaera sp. TaxID=165188 RepID=UPI002592AE70|nr:LPD38 domain-containing protein [uncultured Megasphaera sp.]
MNEFQKILLGAGVDPYKKEREAQQPRQEESKGLLAGLGNMQEKFAGYEASDADKSAGEQVIQKWMDESKDSYVNQAALNAATGAMNVAAGFSSAFGNDTLSDAVEKYQQMQPRRPEFDYTGSEYWTSPQGAWADLWQGLGSSVPMLGAGALVPEAVAVRGAGLLGNGLGRVGLGRIANSNAGRKILDDIVRGVPGAFIDSGSEYGSVANDLRKQGDDNAAIHALPVLGANLALNLFTTPVEYALMKGAGSRIFSPKAGEGIAKRVGMAVPRAIPGIAASTAIEGPQELLQETISGIAKGEQVGNPLNPYSWTPEQLQSFVAGAVGGAGMAAPGNIVGGLRSPGEIIEESIRDNAPAADSGNVNTGLKTPEEIIRDSMPTQQMQEDEPGTSQGVSSSASAQPTMQTNGNEYQAAIVQAAQQYNIPTNIALGIAARETGGDDVNAINMSENGGLMQITEESARDYGINEKYQNWRTDPKQNALAGMDILSQKIKENNGDVWAGVRAYNGAGPQADAYLEQVRQNAQNLGGMHDTNTGFSTYNLPTQGADIDEQITRLTPELRAALPAIGGILNDMGLAQGSAISSAARSAEHNAEVGGAEGSYHIDSGNGGNAVDIVLPEGTSQEQAEAVAERFQQTGAFEEVLFHDAGSGYHLHLGGYKGGLNGRAMNTETNTVPSFQDDLQKFEDAEIPDFASSMKNTTTNAEEYDLFDNMFTSDRKGRDKFVNTPENRRMIRERYQDALEEAALHRMANDVLERPAGRLDSTAATNLSNAVKTGDAGAIRKILTNMYDVNNRNLTQAEARQGRDLPVEQMSQRIRTYLDNTALEDIGEERYNSLYDALRSGDDTALREAYQAIQSRQGGITNAGTGTSINTARPAEGIQNQNGSAVPQGGEGAAEQGQAIAGQGSQTADLLNRNRQAISQRPTGITETMRADDPNVQFTGQYRLVSADDLTTSDSAGYPQQYQPRNRNRAAMRAQVANMTNNLNPSAVVDATGNVNLGAPVIDESGVVLNGNGRTMAIRQAYQRNGRSAQNYKQYLKAHADAFGMTPDMIDSIENPVLVRQVGSDAPITDIIHSTAGGADMSAGEQAKSDAGKIKKTTLDLYNAESQSLTSAGNREFVKAVLRDISTGRDANRMYTENGQFSSDAIRRVQNAIFAKAYGDDHLLNQLSESNDNNIRNIISAMLKAAPTVAKINHGIQQNEYYPYPISQVISDAAKTITSLREQGKEVQFYLNETSLFGESFRNPSSVKDVMTFFDQNKRNSRKIYEFIDRLCERVIGQGNPRQQSLLPAPRPKLNEIMNQTIGEMNDGLRSLFESGRTHEAAEAGENVGRMADGVLQGTPGNTGTVQEAGRRNGTEEARSAEQVTAAQESAPSEPITNRPTVKESEIEVSDEKAGDIEALRQALARKGEAVFNVEDYEKALQEQGDSYTVSDYAKDWMKQKFPNVARDNEAYREIERLVAEQMQAAIAQESQGAASTRAALDWVLNEDKAPMSVVEAYKAHVEAVLNDVERGNMSAQEAQTEIRDSFRGVRKSSSWDTIQGMDFMYNQVLTASEKAHKELQGRIASQSAEIKKAADEGDTVNEENKKDALVSQEPESSNEALGTPAVNASLSTANVAQTQGEVNETTASSKGNAQDVNDIRDSFALRVLYAADPSQRGGYGLKWKKKKANNLLQKYDLGPYEADGKYYVKLTSKDTSAVDLPDIEVPKSEYDYVMNLTGKNEGGNSNAIADSAGAVAARPSERTHQNELGETAESGRPGRSDGQGVSSSDERRTQPVGDVGVSGRGPAAGGTAGDSRVQTQESNDNARSTGSPKLSGGVRAGLEGVPADEQRRPADIVKSAADGRADEANRIIEEQQKKAKDAKRIAEIRKEVPVLLPEQADDVLFAEKRLFDNDKNGVLFTNGTGTGKTFSGMGIVKRMYDRGKKNILIVAPGDGIIQQWIDAGKDHFNVPITPLKSTKDAGKGVCITTYSNLSQNHALASRDWDLLIMDESHTLSKNEQGNSTSALRQFWGLTVHDNGYQTWFEDTHQDITNARKEARKELDKAQKEKDAAKEKDAQQRYDEADRVYQKAYEASEPDYQGKKHPKVVFLSATPFAYIKNLQYAEGFLFEYPKNRNGQKDANQFLMDHFGYQYKNGHLERPGVEVDGSLMGKQFHDQLVQEGALHGRTLEVDADYDRGFIRVNNGIGNKIDEGFTYLAQNSNKYSELNQFIQKEFDYIHKRQLLEAIKAKEAVELVKQYVKRGKKVVVFHDYNEGGGMNPFNLTEEYVRKKLSGQKNIWLANRVVRQLEEFKKKRPDLLELDLNELKSPIETFQNAFNAEEVGFYNGQNKKTRIAEKDDFNDNNGKKKILVVQSNAGEAGISLHDTTGKYQRVLINLGMPTRPTATIQIEGRIYRVGNKSNAIFRYLNTGTVMEGEMFSKMAERSGMVEAIAMGEKARALQASINAAYEESQEGDGWKKYLPGSPTEGTGGKAIDYVDDQLSTYDKAKAFYFATQKKTSKNKSAEGTDYYATPEPLGLKMVEWADPKSGENMMEPSAGHGAIARWMPDYTRNTVVEPSYVLQPALQRNVSNANVVNSKFEELDLHNKFGSIVMNPPFGSGGKKAVEHLAKAFRHLNDGGRIVAIIPDDTSTATKKRFEKWFYGDETGKTKAERDGVTNGILRATIHLPAVTFERADTNIRTKVIIIDRYDSRTMREAAAADVEELTIDAKSINELFDQIENLDMPSRIVADERQYSIAQKTDEELRRSIDELKTEIKEAFPGAKNVEEGLNSLRFEMPNGAKITVDMRNQIVATQEELDRAKQEHGYNASDNVVVEGFAETHGKEAYITLSQGSRKGTGFHEAFHVVRSMMLTDKEKAALDKYYKGDEEKQADAYAAWVEARRNGHGTLFGKLWRKVQDAVKKLQAILTRTENVHTILRKIETGEVWNRILNRQEEIPNKPLYKIQQRVPFADIEKLRNFVSVALKNKGKKLRVTLGKVSKEEAAAIKKATGLDVEGYVHIWSSNDVRHVFRRHGVGNENEEDQIGLTPEDIVEAVQVIQSPHKIEIGSPSNEGLPSIRYIKKQPDGTITVAEVVRDAKKTLSIKTMWKKHPEKHHADKGLLDTSETAPGKSSSTTSNVAQEGATVNNMNSAIKKDSLPTNTSNDVQKFGKLSSNSPSVAESLKNVNKDRKYSVRDERSEVEKAAENYVAPEDLLQKARDIVPIYTGAKVNKQMPAYKRYNNKARGGLISAPNASELASVVAMHVHNVLRIKGANVELTRSVLQEAENADPYLRLFDKNGKDIGLTPAQALQEGVSIFGRYYFTDPELARERFPEYHKKFQAALNSDETLKNKVEAFQSAVEQMQKQDVLLRARGGFVRKNMTPRTFRDRVVDGLRDFYGHWVDDTDPIGKAVKEAEIQNGQKVAFHMDAQKQALMARGNAVARATLVLTGGKDAKASFKALNSVYGNVFKSEKTLKDAADILHGMKESELKSMKAKTPDEALDKYLTAMRTEELVAHDEKYWGPPGYETAKERKQIIDAAPKSIRDAAQICWDLSRDMVDFMEHEGLVTAKAAETMRGYKYYCPMFRQVEGADFGDDIVNTFNNWNQYVNLGSTIHRLEHGGPQQIRSPFESMIKMVMATMDKAERNNVGKALVKLATDSEGLGKLVLRDTTLKAAKPSVGAFSVWINGKKQIYRTTPELYKALTSTDESSARSLFSIFRSINRMMRRGATISPSFITRNFIRDTLTAGINSKTGFIPLWDSIKGMKKLLTDADFAAEFYASGGGMGTYTLNEIHSSKDIVTELMDKNHKGKVPVIRDIARVLRVAFNKYDRFANVIEDSTRAGEFARAREKGLSIPESGYLAKEVTLNFGRHGSYGKIANQYVAFFNATVQGTDKFIRAFRERPVRTALMTTLYLVLPTIGLWLMNGDDDWYKDLDPNTKYMNWCISLGDVHLLIPKPQEAGVLFASGVEAALNYLSDQDPEAMKQWRAIARDVVAPSVIPTTVVPLLEWYTNYSFWRNRPIVSQRMKNKPTEYQYTSSTSEVAKLAGETGLISPMMVDNFISGYFASAGRLVANSLNLPIRAAKGVTNPQPAQEWYQLPFIASFLRPHGQNSEYVNRFYEMSDDMEKEFNARKEETGKKNLSPSHNLKIVRKARQTITKLNKDIYDTQDNPKLSAEQKKQRIDANRAKIRMYAKKALDAVQK